MRTKYEISRRTVLPEVVPKHDKRQILVFALSVVLFNTFL
jgi:hypothetical protein